MDAHSARDSEIDFTTLSDWMDAQGLPPGGISDVERLSGGTQNVLVQFRRGARSYILRHPPFCKRPNSDQAMRREARVLSALAHSDVPLPRLIAACSDESVIGSAFYLMGPVDGVNPTIRLPSAYQRSRSWRTKLGLAMAECAARVGNVNYIAVGLGDFGNPVGFLERQVARWRDQLESYSLLPGYPGPDIPGLDEVAAWLDDNRPQPSAPGLIHGDYHLANILVVRDRPAIAAIVDWELATIGDPLLDLGWLLATWPDAGHPMPGAIGAEPWDGFPDATDLVTEDSNHSPRDLGAINWYAVLACYKMGLILEGTHARACAGQADKVVGDRLHASAVGLFERALRRIRL